MLSLVWRDRDSTRHPGDTLAVDRNLTEAALPAGILLTAGSDVLRVRGVPNDGCIKWKVREGKAAHD